MARPRLTDAEIRYLCEQLFLKKEGRYDSVANRWVYPEDVRKKLALMLAARKVNHVNQTTNT